MTNEHNNQNDLSREEQMDAALQSMTQWNGPQTQLWRDALEQVEQDTDTIARSPRNLFTRVLSSDWSTGHKWSALAACVALVIVVGAIMLPATGKARRSAQVSPKVFASIDTPSTARDEQSPEWFAGLDRDFLGSGGNESMFLMPSYAGLPALASTQDHIHGTERLVERKVTIQLEVENARQAYLKARSLVSEASGEFVQGGRIDQQSDQPRADLVLRVRADRLEEVLMALREIGEVKNEQVQAADVTDQMFDIEARLKNERQIEAELQQLLESRPNDKLEDILRVRHELGEVRQQIERLEASRSNLSQLVSLATVTVLVVQESVEEEPEPEPEELGLWGQFKTDLGDGLRTGVESLLGFFVWLAEVIVAGIPAWILLTIISVFLWRAYRRSNPKPLAV